MEVPAESIWRHVKTQGLYMVLLNARMEADTTQVVVYQSYVQAEHHYAFTTGTVWVRPLSEFADGRFERVGPL